MSTSVNSKHTPIIKWVGGKSTILDKLFNQFPTTINNYYEPFIGGGSVLFELLKNINNGSIQLKGKIYAYDINKHLINFYKHLQTNTTLLYKYIEAFIDTYNKIQTVKGDRKPVDLDSAKKSKESFYYFMRTLFNKLDSTSIHSAALLVVINKTCFRGLYRVNSTNTFNTPFGNYKTVNVDKHNFEYVANLIKDVHFECSDFTNSLKNVSNNTDDFIYLDPPYVPIESDSFVSYSVDGFDNDKHTSLFNILNNDIKCKFVLSNSKTKMVEKHFEKYNQVIINCKRRINSKKPGSTTDELIIYN